LSHLKQWILAGGLVLAALTFTGYEVAGAWHNRLAASQAEVQTARMETQRALAEAAAADVISRGAQAHADSLEATVAALNIARSRAHVADSSNRSAFANTAAVAPDTCKPIVAAAQAALASAAHLDTLDKARADTAQLEADSYRESARAALVALANLTAASRNLNSASGELAKQANGPSFLARIAPKVGAGVAAGLNPQGHFDTVAGLTLGWTFGGHR